MERGAAAGHVGVLPADLEDRPRLHPLLQREGAKGTMDTTAARPKPVLPPPTPAFLAACRPAGPTWTWLSVWVVECAVVVLAAGVRRGAGEVLAPGHGRDPAPPSPGPAAQARHLQQAAALPLVPHRATHPGQALQVSERAAGEAWWEGLLAANGGGQLLSALACRPACLPVSWPVQDLPQVREGVRPPLPLRRQLRGRQQLPLVLPLRRHPLVRQPTA